MYNIVMHMSMLAKTDPRSPALTCLTWRMNFTRRMSSAGKSRLFEEAPDARAAAAGVLKVPCLGSLVV